MHDRRNRIGNEPHGGVLVLPIASRIRGDALRDASRDWRSWRLTARQLCDLELLLNGGYSPLTGFMTRADYDPVCRSMRLASGLLWPIPITLDTTALFAAGLQPGVMIALRDPEGVMLAAMHVEDVWPRNPQAEADALAGTTLTGDQDADGLLHHTHDWYVGGRVEGIEPPVHHDFASFRLTPSEVRAEILDRGWTRVIGFAPRALMHRAHVEATQRAMRTIDAGLLVHAGLGASPRPDVHHYSRMRCYSAVMATYPPGTALLTLSPMTVRGSGPRDALWQAIVRKNFGCTHWLAGDETDTPPDRAAHEGADALALDELRRHEAELGLTILPFPRMVYDPARGAHVPETETGAGRSVLRLSAPDVHRRLARGDDIPPWFTYPEVLEELRRTFPPRHRQGLTLFFTGLSGSGKSTLANAVLCKLLEAGGRPVTLLDGDVVRRHLSSELGFSREHRTLNVRRIGYVASEITRSGGVAICALIAPHDAVRQDVRQMIAPLGGFVLVHVATPLEVCEQRDRKGLYAKARAGLLPGFTGISDPYEVPCDPDLTIDTSTQSVAAAAGQVMTCLEAAGYLIPQADAPPLGPAADR